METKIAVFKSRCLPLPRSVAATRLTRRRLINCPARLATETLCENLIETTLLSLRAAVPSAKHQKEQRITVSSHPGRKSGRSEDRVKITKASSRV